MSRIEWMILSAGLAILAAGGSAGAACFDPPESDANCEVSVPDSFPDIQSAVDFVDTCCVLAKRIVSVSGGPYSENLTLPQTVTMLGLGIPRPVIEGLTSGPVVDIPYTGVFGPVFLLGLELRGGTEGLSAGRAARLDDVFINQSTPGGIGIHVLAGQVRVDGGRISVAGDPGSTGVLVAPAVAGTPADVILGSNVPGSPYRAPLVVDVPSGVGVDVLPGGSADLIGCEIRGTSTGVVAAGRVTLRSSLIADSGVGLSITPDAGAALDASLSTIANNTIGIQNLNSTPASLRFTHGIAWANASGDFSDLATCDQFETTDLGIGACSAGANPNQNLDIDPLFVDAANPSLPARDYHLTLASPLLDPPAQGVLPSDFMEEPCRDLDGTPRLKDANGDFVAVSDVGAYELPGPPVPGTLAADVTGLRFLNKTNLTWNPDALSSTYSVLRGTGGPAGLPLAYTLPALFPVAQNVAGGPVADAAIPPVGSFFYYLVQGTDASGLDGTLGYGTCAERSK